MAVAFCCELPRGVSWRVGILIKRDVCAYAGGWKCPGSWCALGSICLHVGWGPWNSSLVFPPALSLQYFPDKVTCWGVQTMKQEKTPENTDQWTSTHMRVCVCVTISIAKMESKFSDSERVLNKRRVYQREWRIALLSHMFTTNRLWSPRRFVGRRVLFKHEPKAQTFRSHL